MTREETKNLYNGMPIVFQVIDKIYDYFESRTCENCTYRIESDYSGWSECNKCCSEEIVYGTNDGVVSSSFGCNNFEKKEN
jgi:hypothetical protein